ncbi:hypothetical protein [uncultured Algibacter sp.]|uniref:hypothetical protein n=1 Tax=uncultured Algibacter sp. TaxID=298659 RepID=UPI0026048A26|nr:hypothetical protein [uncultured Algibacter sp.]
MKKILLFSLALTVFVSCKKETKSEKTEETISADSTEKTAKQSDGLTLLKGDFVYYDGAAVLQTHADIYGVFVTDKMLELNTQAESFKKVPTDMVQVEIRGKITNKKDEKILWERKVEIVEILKVSAPKEDNDVVKLGN